MHLASSNREKRTNFKSIQREEPGNERGENKGASSIVLLEKHGELTHQVDLDSGAGASGFMGEMSPISWIRRAYEILHCQTTLDKDTTDITMGELDHHLAKAADFNFFMDDVDLLGVDEDHVNPHKWPPMKTAVLLSESYFKAIQGSLSFLVRESFLQSLFSYPRRNTLPGWKERRWLALANLVWAIGSKWLRIIGYDHADIQQTHLLYYARARALGLDHRVMVDHPDIDRVQGLGLLAFYLLINGSISR